VEQHLLAPWRSPLARALHRNRSQPQSRYCQLATIQANGRPANRTVVFRGFRDRSNQLKIVTDCRSDKIEQIQNQPWGEICWYFSQSREQFRLAGDLILVTASDRERQNERHATWQALSNTARQQFAWPHPKQPRSPAPAAFDPPPPAPESPPETFGLLLLEPQQVDHLQLRGNPQNRHIYWRDEGDTWQNQEVNP
jgi:pyridoxamine 5'-phosphate oxidase